MVVSVGSDHAGFGLKMKMLEVIRGWGYEVVDNGCYDNSAPVYFPEVAKKVCQPVLDGKAEKAIMFCGHRGWAPPSPATRSPASGRP